MSLRLRLSLLLLVSVGVVLLLLVRSVLFDVRPQYLASMEDALVDVAHVLAASVPVREGEINVSSFASIFSRAHDIDMNAQIYDKHKQRLEINCYICNKNGELIFSSDHPNLVGSYYGDWNDVYLCLRGKYGARTSLVDPEKPETAILYVAAPIRDNGEIIGSLTVSKPSDGVTPFVNSGHKHIIIVSILSLILLALMITVVTLWVTRPVHRLRDFVHKIREQEQAVEPHFTVPELSEVAKAISELRSALDGKEYVETYVQQLTHELKSPLSVITGATELLHEHMGDDQRQKFLNNMSREARRMRLIVDRILLLASLENRRDTVAFENLDVLQIVQEVVDALSPLANEKNQHINFMYEPDSTVSCEGDPDLLEMAVRNIVLNAMQYSENNSEIDLSINADTERIVFMCEDEGPGVPDYALSRLGERFYSIQHESNDHKGTGLGLSLVEAVVDLHGGKMQIKNKAPHGLQIRLEIPQSPVATS